jgi:hypothetical protein
MGSKSVRRTNTSPRLHARSFLDYSKFVSTLCTRHPRAGMACCVCMEGEVDGRRLNGRNVAGLASGGAPLVWRVDGVPYRLLARFMFLSAGPHRAAVYACS